MEMDEPQHDSGLMSAGNDHSENTSVEIIGLGDHGDDHAIIKIKLPSGEEVELHFDYDGQGMLKAQHGEHEYSIPVEVEHEEHESDQEEREEHEGHAEGHVTPTFESFLAECWNPITEGYSPTMSEDAVRAIKSLCEELLIKEAESCHLDQDPMHTYESYLNEVGQCLTECMMEAAQTLKV